MKHWGCSGEFLVKRRFLIVSLTLGVIGASSIALADRVTALIDKLPMQTTDNEFSVPVTEATLNSPFKSKGRDVTISVATATPFGGDDEAVSGAVKALQSIAERNPGVALNSPELLGNGGLASAYRKSDSDLLTTVASGTSDETEPTSGAPRSLATKLFDEDEQSWLSSIHADSPLVGSIVSADGSPSDTESLVKAVKGARYVLLGEIHDNPDHHRLQASIIRDVAADEDRHPAVVFEMIPETFSNILANLDASTEVDLSGLAKKLSWNERGWPDFSIYAPVFQAALDNSLPIVAGNLDRDTVRRFSSKAGEGISAADRARLGLDLPVDPALSQDLMAELKASHCGLLPEEALKPMELAQRLRDGAMAAAMIDAADENGSAVLIAGSGHVRNDRGVPAVIEGLTGQSDAVAVQMVEIAGADADEASDYGMSNETPAPFDFTIFTPKANDTDHCAEMEAMMKKGAGEKTKAAN
ncbi:ChaN family lipoprotein [Fulvimarina sp. MAC3]|uniref:ChaN family lipoprotein n=1 Tax=Fulvimarina sp. MAC3 TaxID=3148887 RepID=UPI0031FDD7FA